MWEARNACRPCAANATHAGFCNGVLFGVKKTDPNARVIWRGAGGGAYRVEEARELILRP